MLTRLGLAVFPGIGIVGADQVAGAGPDLQGVALIITSISGLIATIGALVIGLKKKPDDTTERVLKLLEEQAKKDDKP